ncbi:formaldehyde-activating enzyme [Streptomyces sp. NPDC048191]|uniref:formaldehyde-activating enzyme n=1 Tax=Streptomyces sp. NPDC048191 TaxID=3155484 RepID=UPI00340F3BCD
MDIGESFIGEGPNGARITTVVGPRSGPVGTAWAAALATCSREPAPFLAAVRPGVPVQPMTLFISKVPVISRWHGEMILGPAQAGVAAGVADAVLHNVIPECEVDLLVILASVWVSSAAGAPDQVYANSREASHQALSNGSARLPSFSTVHSALQAPGHPFLTAGPGPHGNTGEDGLPAAFAHTRSLLTGLP